MRVAALALLVMCLATPRVLAQAGEEPAATPLHESRPVIVEGQRQTGTMGPFQCDNDHNVLLGIPGIEDGVLDPSRGVLIKASPAGRVLAHFTIPPDASKLFFRSYFLDPDGGVYWVAWEPMTDVTTVYRYGKDGNLQSKVRLDARMNPLGPMGVFPDGRLLLAGVASDRAPGELPNMQPYTGLFDASGKLLKKVVLEDDARLEEAVRNHDEGSVPTASVGGNAAVTHGAIALGRDGNLYLMRHANPAVIYAISNSGDVVRSYQVPPTQPDLVPHALFYEEGQLAVAFVRWGTQSGIRSISEIRLLDPGSGEVTATYLGDESLGGGVVCYERGGKVTFIGAKDGHMALRFAEP